MFYAVGVHTELIYAPEDPDQCSPISQQNQVLLWKRKEQRKEKKKQKKPLTQIREFLEQTNRKHRVQHRIMRSSRSIRHIGHFVSVLLNLSLCTMY